MADIELVIKIPEYRYNRCKANLDTLDMYETLADAVRKGKVLSKGHGNLVDIKEVEEYLNNIQLELDGWGDTDSAIEIAKARMGLDTVPTIIEADTESRC